MHDDIQHSRAMPNNNEMIVRLIFMAQKYYKKMKIEKPKLKIKEFCLIFIILTILAETQFPYYNKMICVPF